MKVTAGIPVGVIAPEEFQSMTAIAEMARALEAARVDACYVTDHPAPSAEWLHAHGHDALDPFTALAFVAAASTKIWLHTNILVLPYRNPFITAKAAATLQVLSGERLILGLGAGYQKAEFDALGVDFHRRGALMDEALEVLGLAWAGGSVVKQGSNFNAPGNEPRPALDRPPCIWIGGGSDRAVERAALWGSGWSPHFTAPTMSQNNRASAIQTLQQLDEKVRRLQEKRVALGRSETLDVIIGPRCGFDSATQATANRLIDEIGELARVGVTWVMLDPPHPTRAAYIENVQWLGQEVMPHLS